MVYFQALYFLLKYQFLFVNKYTKIQSITQHIMHKHPTDLHNLFSSYFSVLLSAMYYSQLLTISPFLEIKNTDNEKHHRKKRITITAINFINHKTCTLLLLIIPFQIFHSRRIVCKNYTDNGTDFYFRTVSASGNTFF